MPKLRPNRVQMIPNMESFTSAIDAIGTYLDQQGAQVKWGGNWNKSFIIHAALSAWLDTMHAGNFPTDDQVRGWVERYRAEYVDAGSPNAALYRTPDLIEKLEAVSETLRDYKVGLIYFGQKRFNTKLVMTCAVWRYQEEIQGK